MYTVMYSVCNKYSVFRAVVCLYPWVPKSLSLPGGIKFVSLNWAAAEKRCGPWGSWASWWRPGRPAGPSGRPGGPAGPFSRTGTSTPGPSLVCTAKNQYRKFKKNIPRKGTARPQSQFPHSCVCKRFLYCRDRSAYSDAGNMLTDPGNLSIAHRHMNVEIGTEAVQFPDKEYINGTFFACGQKAPEK